MERAHTLITGASTGIGRGLAEICARERHDLILTARDGAALEAMAAPLRSRYGGDILVLPQDLSKTGSAPALVGDIRAAGRRVGIVINNAGVGLYGAFLDTDLAAETRMIQLNVVSLVELTKLCLPEMVTRGGGRILNVASTAGFVPGPLMAVYYATKAFVLSFSDALAEELRHSGVTVTTLCPGPTATQFQKRAGAGSARIFSGAKMDAAAVAEVGYRAMMDGRRVVVAGARNRLVPLAARLFPRQVVARLSRRASESRMRA
jgi:short-subunit dehydrogenase